jgi:protein-tyrosine phosphatase
MQLMRILTTVLIVPLALAAGIENLSCDQTGPNSYRIQFTASDSGPIRVYASVSPDRIDSPDPVATTEKGPVEISIPGKPGRVYFHLKPARGASRVVAVRRLPLEGAVNFRDLGGYETENGKHVRWGRVYRSNQLSTLTPGDYEYLASLGVRVVCDLRTNYERERMPTVWKGVSPEFLIASVTDERAISESMQQLKKAMESGSRPEPNRDPSGYADILFQSSGLYANVLRQAIRNDGAVLTHCSGGADRTGIYAALLLSTLGVPHETVIADYLLTRQVFLEGNNYTQLAGDLQKLTGMERAPDPALIRGMMSGMSREQMEGMFSAIDKKYGSFGKFLEQSLGLSTAEIRDLRDRLLE